MAVNFGLIIDYSALPQYNFLVQRKAARSLKRETQQIFDLILKRLLKLSSLAVIQFINGLFDADHPLDGTVEYPNTEHVSHKLRRLMSDMIVI